MDSSVTALERRLMGIAGRTVQVRNPDTAHFETRAGPFMSSAMAIAVRRDRSCRLAEAIEKVSRLPCAVADGAVEVWPLE